MDPQAHSFSTQAQAHPRIAYYIARSNGVFVPLIPVDELPFNVRLQNLPRTLRQDQTYGMQYVGTLPFTGATFKLENELGTTNSPSQSAMSGHMRTRSNSPYQAPDNLARHAMANASGLGINTGSNKTQHPLPARPMSAHELATQQWRKTPLPTSSDSTQAVIDAIVNTTQGPNAVVPSNIPPPPSGQLPDQEKKKYCTYWIRTGECDYMQQGCLYLHEMPDLDTLKSIGFRGTPRWWIEKTQKVRMNVGSNALTRDRETFTRWPEQTARTTASGADGIHNKDESDSEREDSGPKLLSKKLTTDDIATPRSSPLSRSSSATLSQVEHLSDTGDLIDFGDGRAAVPTPPTSSESSQSETSSDKEDSSTKGERPNEKLKTERPVKSDGSSEHKGSMEKQRSAQENKSEQKAKPLPKKIFVPAGESPEVHIAQAQKRASRTIATPSRASKTTGLQNQIQSLQKSKNGGLMASKHATSETLNSPPKAPSTLCRKRVPKRESTPPTQQTTSQDSKPVVKLPKGTKKPLE